MAIIKNPLTLMKGEEATLIEKSITENGTYNASSDNADGYSKVVVNVSGGGDIQTPFDDTRCIKVPKGYLYKAYKVSHYLVCGAYDSGAGGFTIGYDFCVYDMTSKQVIHSVTNMGYNATIRVYQIADNKYLANIGRYGYRESPAQWFYDSDNDSWTYYENGSSNPLYTAAIRYSGVSYKGADFGIFKADTDTFQYWFIKPDNTCIKAQNGYSSGTLVETADSEFVYRGAHCNGNSTQYYNNGDYKVARSAVATPNQFYDLKTFSMGTSNASRRFIYQCGRLALFTGIYSTSYGWYLVDMGLATPAQISMPSITDTYVNKALYNPTTNQAFFFQNNKRILMIDINKYLNGESYSSYCKVLSTTYFSYNDYKLANGRVFVHLHSSSTAVGVDGLYELTFNDGLTLLFQTPQNSNFCMYATPKENDIMLIPTTTYSSSSAFGLYVYHMNTNTYTDLCPSGTMNSISRSISSGNTLSNLFTGNLIEGVYFTPDTNNGVIIYNSILDTYFVLRTPSNWSTTSSSYYKVINDTYMYGYAYGIEGIYTGQYNPVLVSKDGVYFVDLEISSSSNVGFSPGCYSYNNKDYFTFRKYNASNVTTTFIMCFDTVNKTFTLNNTFVIDAFGSNFGLYAPITCYNKEFFTYYQIRDNGKNYDNCMLASVSASLIFDKTNETWSYDNTNNNRFIQLSNIVIGNKIICRNNSSGNSVVIYDVENDTTTSIGYVPANISSWKVLSTGVIIVKTTTQLVKYVVSTGTATVLASGNNNSNSNNYGYLYAYKTVCIACTILTGIYNSSTDTYTAATSVANFYASNYSKSITTFGENGLFFYCYRSGYNQTSYYFIAKADASLTSFNYTTMSNYLVARFKSDKLLLGYNTYPSGANYNSTVYIIKYNLNDLTSTTESKVTNISSSSSSVGSVRTMMNQTFFYFPCYVGYDIETEEFFNCFESQWTVATTMFNTMTTQATIPAIKKGYVFPPNNDLSKVLFSAVVTQYSNTNQYTANVASPVYTDSNQTIFIGKWAPTPEELGGE